MNKTFPSPQEGPLQNKTQRATPNKGEKNMLWIRMTVLDTLIPDRGAVLDTEYPKIVDKISWKF